MKKLQVEIGPLVGTRRALWLIGDVDAIRIGDTLVTDNGDKITIDAIGMAKRKPRNSLSVLTAENVNPNVKTAYIN